MNNILFTMLRCKQLRVDVFMHEHGDLNNKNCDIMYCNI